MGVGNEAVLPATRAVVHSNGPSRCPDRFRLCPFVVTCSSMFSPTDVAPEIRLGW